MNNLTSIPTVHPTYRKRLAEQKELKKRNDKAKEYLDKKYLKDFIPNLARFYNNHYLIK